MSLSGALSNALSGLRVTQTSVDVISGNVANADSVGYTRRQVVTSATDGGQSGSAVQIAGINRMLDAILQRDYRTETSGAAYSATKLDYMSQAVDLFGQPGGSNSLDSLFSGFTNALQGLATDPSSSMARTAVLSSADVLARGIRTASDGIQTLRSDAETEIASAVQRANELIRGISEAGVKILATGGKDPALLDMRDAQITELASLMDVKVTDMGNGSVSVSTQSGMRLCDPGNPVTLGFDARATVGPNSSYDPDPTKRTVGTITVTDSSGAKTDLIAQNAIRSGKIAALVQMRDSALVQAQAQLDEMAANLSTALSNRIVPGTAVTSGTQAGFDVDTAGLLSGNTVTVQVTSGGVTQKIALVRVEDPSQLPLKAGSVPGADQVVGVSFSGGMAGVAAALAGALGANYQVTASGTTLRILDNGAGTAKVDSVSASITNDNTKLTGSGPELPLFTDGGRANAAYTGSFDGGSSKVGFASRISVNSLLLQDPSRLVVFSTSPLTPAGDATRPALLRDRLLTTSFSFSSDTGIGGAKSPFSGTVRDFFNQVVQSRANSANDAKRLDEGQKVVLTSIESRLSKVSGVSVDQEMANLVQVQNAYAANARIMSAVRDMMDLLMRM